MLDAACVFQSAWWGAYAEKRGELMAFSRKALALTTAASFSLALTGCMGEGSIPSASTPITQQESQQGAQSEEFTAHKRKAAGNPPPLRFSAMPFEY